MLVAKKGKIMNGLYKILYWLLVAFTALLIAATLVINAEGATTDEKINRWLSTIPESVATVYIIQLNDIIMLKVKGYSTDQTYIYMVGGDHRSSSPDNKSVQRGLEGHASYDFEDYRGYEGYHEDDPNHQDYWIKWRNDNDLGASDEGPSTSLEVSDLLRHIRDNYPANISQQAEWATFKLILIAHQKKLKGLWSDFEKTLRLQVDMQRIVDRRDINSYFWGQEKSELRRYVQEVEPDYQQDWEELFNEEL